MQVNIVQLSKWRIPRKFIQAWMLELSKVLKKKTKVSLDKKEVAVVFVSETQMKKLNKDFRSKDKVTDILSFSGFGENDLGELVLCGDLIKKQALDHDVKPNEELGYLLIHGVLHLLGYDHEKDPDEARIMLDLQDEIFEGLRYHYFE